MSTAQVPTTPPRLHVLVVDDDSVQRTRTQAWLESAGYLVTPCSGLAQFEHQVGAQLTGERVDLVLFDVLMPGFVAGDLERLLRHFPATSSSPIVLHSPLPAATLRRLARTSGSLGILETTLSREEFLSSFRAFAESLFLRRRLRAASSGTHRLGPLVTQDAHERLGSTRSR